MASFLIAAAIAAASVAPAPAPALPATHIPDADPAIWVVNRPRHRDLSVRHLPRARRPVGLVQRRNPERGLRHRTSWCETIVPDTRRPAAKRRHRPRVPNLPLTPSASSWPRPEWRSPPVGLGAASDWGADSCSPRRRGVRKPVSRPRELHHAARRSRGCPPSRRIPRPARERRSRIPPRWRIWRSHGPYAIGVDRGTITFSAMMLEDRTNSPETYDVCSRSGTAIGRTGSPAGCNSPARYSSRSAPATSPKHSVQAKLGELGIRSARIN